MSLAFHASPFDSEPTHIENKNNGNDTLISRKKNANNRTQKRTTSNSDKVNSMLASIHNDSSNSDGGELADFNPPSMPQSSGVQNTILKENMSNINSRANQSPPEYPPHQGAQMFSEDYSSDMMNGDNNSMMHDGSGTAEEYYKRMVPNFQQLNSNSNNPNLNPNPNPHLLNSNQNRAQFISPANKPYYKAAYATSDSSMNRYADNDDIMEKLNYMINLLEENHDERTGNVTEEVILYSFLGIFIIFIADSFARVGKYTR
jgi:hypothetical protein